MLALRFGLATLAIVVGLGLAVAQPREDLASPQQKNEQEKAQHGKDGRAGTTEPSSQTPTTQRDASWVFENGRLNTPGAPADSQTVPSTISPRNAALDELPTMAFPLPFTDEQRQRIRDAVSKAPVEGANARAAELLPSGINVRELPRQITDQIPASRNLGYVRTADRILLISPPNRIVVGEIGELAPSAVAPGCRPAPHADPRQQREHVPEIHQCHEHEDALGPRPEQRDHRRQRLVRRVADESVVGADHQIQRDDQCDIAGAHHAGACDVAPAAAGIAGPRDRRPRSTGSGCAAARTARIRVSPGRQQGSVG